MKIRTVFRITPTHFPVCAASLLLAVSLFSGCTMPGRPAEEARGLLPHQVKDFDALYSTNCSGCHGATGQKGSAAFLANPIYQALVDDATLHDIIANGFQGTLMPAFSRRRGGPLTEEQISALIAGMRARWSKGNVLEGQNAPPYKATHEGDAAKGKEVYTNVCAQCHEPPEGNAAGVRDTSSDERLWVGSIRDGSFLALVNEQMIRTTVIGGRSDLGMPDWRKLREDSPLTDEEITNVTAWLMSQKPAMPGQPYANGAKPAGKEQQ
jgi:cytochrome c oxidase cbb3-type subunit III